MSALRDSRIGRVIRGRGGIRPLIQAEQGGSPLDKVVRMESWRKRYARVPLEQALGSGYRPIPRCRSLVPFTQEQVSE
jgi:hypothetical protein